jgi:nucleoside 2-deoxyribosyltransferase
VSAARLLPSVYLAGGSRSSWQDVASERLSGWNIIDPRTHQLSDEHAYTAWDLEGIRRSDWVLANFEATNPGGYNLALEVGYAKALGKRIILIDEKGSADPSVRRYTSMLHACSDFTPQSLDEAISFLQKLMSIA